MMDTILEGDCLEVMKQFPENFIDLTVTSPPYDNLRKYNGYSFDFEGIAKELFRITKKGGVVVWAVGDATIDGSETGTSFRQALYFKEIGFKLHDTMIYKKNQFMPLTHNRYEQSFEYMFVFSKNNIKTFNPLLERCAARGARKFRGNSKQNESSYSERKRKETTTTKREKQRENVWCFDVGNVSGDDKTIHNAPFPEKLAADHILSWSNPGDLVLDPMCGSGTTCKMAKYHDRRFIGIEISKEYCEIARKRIAAMPTKLSKWSE